MKNIELIYARHNLSDKAPRIPPSNIAYYDLTILLNGKLEYRINGQNISLESGDVIFMPPESLRTRQCTEDDVDYVSFNFTSSGSFKLPLVLKNAVRSEIVLLIAAYDKIEKHAYPDNREKWEHLCGCILAILEDVSVAEQYSSLTRKIMEYIHGDPIRRITLDDIGRFTFFSPIYCDTVFKKETGKSIIDYVIDRRIDEAKRLLLEGTVPLPAVAEAVGFNDYNYFSRVFKKRSGYSPTAFRRLANAEVKSK